MTVLQRCLLGERPSEVVALMEQGYSIVAVWLRRESETTLKKLYHEQDDRIGNATLQPVYRDPADVAAQGKLVAALRGVA